MENNGGVIVHEITGETILVFDDLSLVIDMRVDFMKDGEVVGYCDFVNDVIHYGRSHLLKVDCADVNIYYYSDDNESE